MSSDLAKRAPQLLRRRDELRRDLVTAERVKRAAEESLRSLRTRLAALEDGILNDMQAMKATSLRGPGFEIVLQSTPPRVDVVDFDAVPEDFIRTKTTRVVDKKSVATAMREYGECVPGTEITTGWTIRIK